MKPMKKPIVYLMTAAMIFSTTFSFPALIHADELKADELNETEIASEAYTLNITLLPATNQAAEGNYESYTTYYQETTQQSYQEAASQTQTETTSTPAEDSSAPTETASTPAETTSTPAETTSTPAETSSTPAETTTTQETTTNDSTTQSSAPASAGGPSSEGDASATDVGPHTHDYWIIDSTATCTSAGYYTAECSICGDQYTTYVDNLGDGAHTFENLGGDMCNYNFCTSCGHVEVSAGIDQWTAAYNTMYFTNNYRTAVGLPELTMSGYLNSLAQQRAIEIASDFSHGGFRGCNGENIAKGYFNTWDVVGAWSCSPGHYENMVRDWFTEYGFGYYVDPAGQIYCVQLFN